MGMQRTIRMEYPERIICLLLQHGQQSLSARVWIFGAKIMQTRAMKTCFQIAECSLSYAKLATFCQNNPLSTQNLSKNACFYSFIHFPFPSAGSTAAASTRSVRNLFRISFIVVNVYITCFRRIPVGNCSGYDIAINQSGVVDVALQRDVGVG